MVAFVASVVVAFLGMGAVVAYGRRRPVGAPLTWGEAIAASTFSFFLLFWAYGVVPHQWLTYAGNELAWRSDKPLLGPGDVLATALPFDMNYEVLSHFIVSGIYVFFVVAHAALWAVWQGRGKQKPLEIETSTYGRPLVRKG